MKFLVAILLALPLFARAQAIKDFDVSGAFTVPAGKTSLTIIACGGGGGGGGGNGATDSNDAGRPGASGGRGGIPIVFQQKVTPGDVLNITLGAGGSGGAGHPGSSGSGTNNGTNGTPGADTFVIGTLGNVTNAASPKYAGVYLRAPGGTNGLGAPSTNGAAAPGIELGEGYGPLYLLTTAAGAGGQAGGAGTGLPGLPGVDGSPGGASAFAAGGNAGQGGAPGTGAVGTGSGGGGGGGGGAGFARGGNGGHGGGGAARAYVTTAAVRASNIVTLTMSSTISYDTNNFNAGELIRVGGLDASFNGDFVVLDAPTSTSIRYAQVGANETAVDGAGTVQPMAEAGLLGGGKGEDGTRCAGGGAGGGGGGRAGGRAGGDGGAGGSGFVRIIY